MKWCHPIWAYQTADGVHVNIASDNRWEAQYGLLRNLSVVVTEIRLLQKKEKKKVFPVFISLASEKKTEKLQPTVNRIRSNVQPIIAALCSLNVTMLLNHKLLLWLIDKHSYWHISVFIPASTPSESIPCSVLGKVGQNVDERGKHSMRSHLFSLPQFVVCRCSQLCEMLTG